MHKKGGCNIIIFFQLYNYPQLTRFQHATVYNVFSVIAAIDSIFEFPLEYIAERVKTTYM